MWYLLELLLGFCLDVANLVNIRIYICIYVCMYIYTYVCIYIYYICIIIYIYIQTHPIIYPLLCIPSYVHIYIYILLYSLSFKHQHTSTTCTGSPQVRLTEKEAQLAPLRAQLAKACRHVLGPGSGVVCTPEAY